MKTNIITRLISGLLLFISTVLYAQEPKLTLSAPSTVSSGQAFQVTFSVNAQGSGFRGPTFKGFDVLSGPNQSISSSSQISNGAYIQSINLSFIYYIQAPAEGTYTIGPASIKVGGKVLESNSATIKVVKGQAPQQNQAGRQSHPQQQVQQGGTLGANDVFVKAFVNKNNPIKGEQVIVTYKIYRQVQIAQLSLTKLPSNKGFWAEDLVEENKNPKQTTEYINGKQYAVTEIRKVALFPQESGKLTVDPLELDIWALIQAQRKRGNSIFDMFFDDPFSNTTQTVKKKLVSNALSINVRPLPAATQPNNYTGAVGNFTFRSSIDKKDLKANEAITFKYTISGSGNIKLIDKLTPLFPPDFEVYDPKITDNIQHTENGVSGTKTFEYLVIPRTAGIYKVQPVSFSYYDLGKNSYVTLNSQEYTINVAKGDPNSEGMGFSATNQEDIKYLSNDIEHIKTKPFKLNPKGSFFFQTPLYWLFLILPLGFFAIAVIIRRKNIKRRSDLNLIRNRKATRTSKKKLRKAEIFLKKNEVSKFYDEIAHALWGYLSDKFMIPLSELSMDSVNEALCTKNVREDIVSDFIKALNHCEFARFAPGDSSRNMHEVYREALEIISKTERELR